MSTRRNISKALTEAPLWGLASTIQNITSEIDVKAGLISNHDNSGLNVTSIPPTRASLDTDKHDFSQAANLVLQYNMVALVVVGIGFNLVSFIYFIYRCCKDVKVSSIYLASLSLADGLSVLAIF